MKTELKNSGKEHQYLKDRLKRLEKHQKKIAPRAKVRTTPLQKNLFDRKAKNMQTVTHRIDYEPHREKEFEKTSNFLQRQADIELDPCTFNPNLNQKSLKMAQAKDHIMERDVPDKYKRSVIEERERVVALQREEEEDAQMNIPDYSDRKPNEKFFNEKFEWKKKVLEKYDEEQKKNFDNEVVGMKAKPTLTKNTIELANRKFNGKKFLDRVPNNIENKKVLAKKLDNKYYNFPHKPKLHKPEKKTKAS